MERNVVITGLGAVSGFGYGIEPLWESMLEGRSCIRRIRSLDPGGLHCQVAAEATDFSVKDHVPKSYRKAVKVMARDIELAVGAAKAAVEHAGIVTRNGDPQVVPTYEPKRLACHIGAGLIASDVAELSLAMHSARNEQGGFSYEKWGDSGMHNLTPLWLLKYLPNMLSCHVTILHDAQGPSNTMTCAEASGLLCIGESMRVLQRGWADAGFAGGAESKINLTGLIRMDLLKRLAHVTAESRDSSTFEHAVRPYDPGATGGILGEGGGILLLETEQTARARGARGLARLSGFGAGHSPRSDDPVQRASGLINAIRAAINDAGITADEIDAIVPHAAAIRAVDDEELAAFRAVFGSRLAQIPIITLTPNLGDAMAGMGGLAACVAAMVLRHQTIPARLHSGAPREGLDVGPAPQRDARLSHVLVCTNAIGGQNAALVLKSI